MLELRNISKAFPGVKALDDVSITIAAGEIHALVGENGAGKSTLMKIICGIYQPDSGEVLFNGAPVNFRSYADSLKAGVDIVYQEIQVVPESTVAESIMMDKLTTRGRSGVIDWKAVNTAALEYMRMVDLDVPPDALMKSLSAAQKRLTQIACALSASAKVILLDEPTSTLTDHEAQTLFGILRNLKDKGVALVFVSHKFEEVFDVCDRATVLRDGKWISSDKISDLTRDELIAKMIGREFTEAHLGRVNVNTDKVVLRAEGVTSMAVSRMPRSMFTKVRFSGFMVLSVRVAANWRARSSVTNVWTRVRSLLKAKPLASRTLAIACIATASATSLRTAKKKVSFWTIPCAVISV